MTFDRGDIVELKPELESTKSRFALVLTPSLFNALGSAMIAPIAQGEEFSRYQGFAVAIESPANSYVLSSRVYSIDLKAAGAVTVDRASGEVVSEVLARVRPLFD